MGNGEENAHVGKSKMLEGRWGGGRSGGGQKCGLDRRTDGRADMRKCRTYIEAYM